MTAVAVKIPTKLRGPCGNCAAGQHQLCRSRYFNPKTHSLIACPCPEPHPPVRCRDCGQSVEELGELLTCADPAACRLRIEAHLADNPLHQLLLECQTTRLESGEVVERPRRDAKFREPKAARSGACLCCGEPTKGGLFLPGHDARFIKILAARVGSGELTPTEAGAALPTDALRGKLTKRLEA